MTQFFDLPRHAARCYAEIGSAIEDASAPAADVEVVTFPTKARRAPGDADEPPAPSPGARRHQRRSLYKR